MPSESLSPAADKFLAEASKEFNAKQKNLDNEWRFDAYQEWSFDVEKGLLELEFHDGTTLIADGQLLGTYCVSDATFEWAWNNPKFKKVITRDSQVVKEVGETLKLSYTQAGMIPMPAEVYPFIHLCHRIKGQRLARYVSRKRGRRASSDNGEKPPADLPWLTPCLFAERVASAKWRSLFLREQRCLNHSVGIFEPSASSVFL